MSINVTFSVADLLAVLPKEQADAYNGITTGDSDISVLGDDAWYQYLTQDDERVRPSHAALHGTYWKVDDPDAPTPPLDYGCRCFIRYCGAPDSAASKLLPEATDGLGNVKEAYTSYLNDNINGWESMAQAAMKVVPGARMEHLTASLKAAGYPSAVLRDLAYMILSVM